MSDTVEKIFADYDCKNITVFEAMDRTEALVWGARIDELLTYKTNLPDVDSTEVWLNTRLMVLTHQLTEGKEEATND